MKFFLNLGDSIQNILGNIFSCGLGYVLGTFFATLELWCILLVWIVLSEVSHMDEDLKWEDLLISDCVHSLHEGQSGHQHGDPPGSQ